MPRQRPVEDKRMRALANEIIALETQSDARRAAKAGRRIIERVFGGNTETLRSKDPTKEQSLATLATMLERSITRVRALISVAVVYDALPVDLRDQLTPSHLETLSFAPELERERLAREAVGAGLSVFELRARVHRDILPDPDDGPPPDRTPLGRAEREAVRVERHVERAKPEERPALASRLDQLIARYTAMRSKLG